jgi:hypothetical protein
VRDDASHDPIPFVSLTLSSDPFASGGTDFDGHYRIEHLAFPFPGDQPVPVTVSANPPFFVGYWPGSGSGSIPPNGTATVNLDLLKVCTGATVFGTVVNGVTLQPIEFASVSVRSPDGRLTSVSTDDGGAFRLTDLRVGTNNSPLRVIVEASAPGFETAQRQVTIFCGASIEVNFGRPTNTGTIQGRVTGSAGGGLADVFIGLLDFAPDSPFVDTTSTDANGFYALQNVPLGPNGADRAWNVVADAGAAGAQTKSGTVRANNPTTLDFVLSSAPPTSTTTPTSTPTATASLTPTATASLTPTRRRA